MTLILMYLYYDVRGEIKGISPNLEMALSDFNYTTMPLKEVEKFLTGQVNPFDYRMQLVAGKPTKLVKKETIKIQPRNQSQFLTEISSKVSKKSDLIFTIDGEQTTIRIDVNPGLLSIYNSYEDEDQDSREELEKLVQDYTSSVYVTDYKNPYNLISSFEFNVKELFDRHAASIKLSETIDLGAISLYTRKIFENYALKRQ